MKIKVLQPCIPEYRADFYHRLCNNDCMDVEIICAHQDFDGLTSINVEQSYIKHKFNISEKYILNGKFIFQSGVSIDDIKNLDALVVVGNVRYISNLYYLLLCRLHRKKIIWWGQGWSAGTTKISYNLKMFFSSFFDGFLFYTDDEVDKAKNNIFFNKRSIALNNGLNLEKIDLAIKNSENGLIDFTQGNEVLELLFIGRLSEKSNILTIIEALRNSDVRVNLTIIGDGILLEKAQKNAINTNKTNFIFKGALYDELEIAKYMNCSDFFIYGGAVGLSLIHAFSYSLPAIIHSNYSLHMPEIAAFTENYNGITFEHDSIESIIETIHKAYCLKENGKLINMKRNARDVVEKRFNTKVMASRFNLLVNKVFSNE